MANLLRTRTTLVWLILVAATALSWRMGHSTGFQDIRYASVTIIVVTFIKVRYVILDFMEVRHAPVLMRLIGETWVLVICAVLIALYWWGPSMASSHHGL